MRQPASRSGRTSNGLATAVGGALLCALLGGAVPATTRATPVTEFEGALAAEFAALGPPRISPRIVARSGSGADAEAAELAATQLVALIARIEAAAEELERGESGVLVPAGRDGKPARPSLSETDRERADGDDDEAAEPTRAPGNALELLARIVNVHGDAAARASRGETEKSTLAKAASDLPPLSDELERYIVSLIEPRVGADGTVYFTFPGVGEFRADFDTGTGVLAVRRGNAEVRMLLEGQVSDAVVGEARNRITWERLMAMLRSLFDDARIWYVLVPMLFLSMFVVRDGSAQARERRRRRRIARKARGAGQATAFENETLLEDATEATGVGTSTSIRRRRRKPPASPAQRGKAKGPGAIGLVLRSLGLMRDTPGKQVPLGGEKRGQRRRRKHRDRAVPTN